jgi:hypothetical protein
MTLATLQHTILNPLSLPQTHQSHNRHNRCHCLTRRRLRTVVIVPNVTGSDPLSLLQIDQLLQINQLLQPIRPTNHQTKWPLNLLSSVAQTSASSLLPSIPQPSPSLPSTSSSTKPAVPLKSTSRNSPSLPPTTTGASYTSSTRASSTTNTKRRPQLVRGTPTLR